MESFSTVEHLYIQHQEKKNILRVTTIELIAKESCTDQQAKKNGKCQWRVQAGKHS
jgi:hypothetical protein